MRKIWLSILLVLLMLPFVQAQEELRQERLLLTFIPNIQFSPLYVGMAQGYFADSGLEISLEYLNEPDVVDLIAAGQANFGVVSGEQVILSASRGREVVYVYNWFRQFPVGVVVRAESDIESPADLAGRRVGIPGRFGANYSGLVALLLSAGLDVDDVDLEEIGFAAPEVFCLGVVEAASVYVNNEPLQIRARAQRNDCGDVVDVRVIAIGDYIDLISNGLITSQHLLQEDPDLVESLVQAFDVALRETINNPARAYLLSVPFIDGLPLSDELRETLEELAAAQDELLASDPEPSVIIESRDAMYATLAAEFSLEELIQFQVLLETIKLWEQDDLGISSLESWEVMQETLLEMGVIDAPIDLSSVYSNGYVPQDTAE